MLGKFYIYVTGSERQAIAEAGPYLHNYRTVADAQHSRRAVARQTAMGNVLVGEPQRCIDIIRHWRGTLGLTVVSGTFYFGGMPERELPI